MIRNIGKWRFVVDGDLLKKLDDRDIWELRRLYKKRKQRVVGFWDKEDKIKSVVMGRDGFMKKREKRGGKEIGKGEEIRKDYFN